MGITDYLKRKNAEAGKCAHVFDRPHDLEKQFGKMCSKCGIAEKGFYGKGPLTLSAK